MFDGIIIIDVNQHCKFKAATVTILLKWGLNFIFNCCKSSEFMELVDPNTVDHKNILRFPTNKGGGSGATHHSLNYLTVQFCSLVKNIVTLSNSLLARPVQPCPTQPAQSKFNLI